MFCDSLSGDAYAEDYRDVASPHRHQPLKFREEPNGI
jgi:hypothetical protein